MPTAKRRRSKVAKSFPGGKGKEGSQDGPPTPDVRRQLPLPSADRKDFSQFKDLSEGVAVSVRCPKCGYEW